MSSAYTFRWPAGPEEVIVTGSFDNWTKSLPLVKQSDGSFELTVPFGEDVNVLYKYLVDGKWLTNPTQSLSADSEGNENNILISDHLFSYEAQSKIPEAGGLAVVPGSLQTTVMQSPEPQQTTLGEAGIFVPKDKDSLAAFSVYENTDRNLNEKPEEEVVLTPEEKKKQKKKLKRTKYKLNKKAKAAHASGDATSTSPETTPIPEADSFMNAEKKEVVPVTDDTPMTTVVNTVSEPMTPKEEASEPEESASAAPPSLIDNDSPESTMEPKTSLKTEETVAVEEEKEPAPYALTEEDIPQSKMAPVPVAMSPVDTTEPEKESAACTFTGDELAQPVVAEDMAVDTETASTSSKDVHETNKAVEEENSKNTLDPTVVGLVGATAAVSKEAMLEASEIDAGNTSDEMTMVPVMDEPVMSTPVMAEPVMDEPVMAEPVMSTPVMATPVMAEPVISAMSPANPVQLAPDSNIEDIPVAPVSQHAKEVTALPVNDDKAASEKEIIIAQGGHDSKEIKQQIMAEENGSVCIEEIQPTVSEAQNLAEEAHIPQDQIKTDSVDEIIIAQGGHDLKEIEQQIAAEEKGPVCIEEIQPTVSEAKNLAEEAHIPRDEIKAASVPEKSEDAMSSPEKTSDNGKSSNEGTEKKKKKRSFFSKLKKIFK